MSDDIIALLEAAADEIERLTAERDELRAELAAVTERMSKLDFERTAAELERDALRSSAQKCSEKLFQRNDECDALRAELAAANARMEWRTIDSAPKDGSEILIFGRIRYPLIGKVGAFLTIGHWQAVDYDEVNGECIEEFVYHFGRRMENNRITPTHWMPLLERPK